jgi:Xaa-Pro aminopeptidase
VVEPGADVELKPGAVVEVEPGAAVELEPGPPVVVEPGAAVELEPGAPVVVGSVANVGFSDCPDAVDETTYGVVVVGATGVVVPLGQLYGGMQYPSLSRTYPSSHVQMGLA